MKICWLRDSIRVCSPAVVAVSARKCWRTSRADGFRRKAPSVTRISPTSRSAFHRGCEDVASRGLVSLCRLVVCYVLSAYLSGLSYVHSVQHTCTIHAALCWTVAGNRRCLTFVRWQLRCACIDIVDRHSCQFCLCVLRGEGFDLSK